jgi:hypothetical protein
MKKIYAAPRVEVIEIEYRGMIALSGGMGGTPSGPAHGREFELWEEE